MFGLTVCIVLSIPFSVWRLGSLRILTGAGSTRYFCSSASPACSPPCVIAVGASVPLPEAICLLGLEDWRIR
jgi:hypothetical protein